MRIQAIAFDVDGTLYPAFSLYKRCVDISLRAPRIVLSFSLVRRQLREMQTRSDYAISTKEELHHFQASLLAHRLKIEESTAYSLLERIFYDEIPQRFSSIQPYSGIKTLLETCRARGFLIAAFSDLPPDKKITSLGLGKLFDRIMCAEDCGRLKPHPYTFLSLSNALGIDPREILYIGNNIEYDIRGAKAVGMHTALRGGSSADADFCFKKWDEFSDWIFTNISSGENLR